MKNFIFLPVMLIFLLAAFSLAQADVIDFEGFLDSTPITTQIPGLTFIKTRILTAGITLNEFEFPPHSGQNIIFDDDGPITINFSPSVPTVGGFFTYLVPLTMTAFDALGNQVAARTSKFSSNLALSGVPGSLPNECVGITFSPGIARVVIKGGTTASSFALDDLTFSPCGKLNSLSPAKLWVGLKNSDDQGTQFDLRTEVYINTTLVAAGQTLCIAGVTRNPDLAKQVTIPFGPISNGGFNSRDTLSLKVLTRIGTKPDGTQCPGHSNAVGLRLYYDAVSRSSQVGAEITPDPLKNFFLHSGSGDTLNATAPTATTATFKDSASVNFKNGNPWQPIGTWNMTLP